MCFYFLPLVVSFLPDGEIVLLRYFWGRSELQLLTVLLKELYLLLLPPFHHQVADLYGCWNDLSYQIKICWLLESPIKTRNTGIENVVEYSHSGSTHTDHLVAFEGSLGRQPSSAIHCLIASYTAAPVCKQSKKYKYSCPRKWKSLRSFRNFSGMIFAEMQKAADMALILHNKLNVVIKGIAHQIFFYCSNLIFWVVMGCGIADFGRRGL